MRLVALLLTGVALSCVALSAAACFNVDLAGRKCNDAHACIDGFTCAAGTCVPDDAVDGGAGEGEGGEGEGDGGEGEGEGEGDGCNVSGDCRNAEVCDTATHTCLADCRIVEGTCAAADICVAATGLCRATVCGDGVQEGLEACDDGADNSDSASNACRSLCVLPSCGDQVTDTAFNESCDDGNIDDTDLCSNACVSALCGNGAQDPGEQCDDGALNSNVLPDACRINCAVARCGDGVTDPGRGEACDEGALNSDTAPNACRRDCTRPRCGDGVTDPANNESCDDGNSIDDDGCSNTCRSGLCGNAVLNAGEGCDDGTANSDTAADACRTTCTPAGCGDGVTDTGEQCDDGGAAGNRTNGDGCDNNCTITACGNAVPTGLEECDDGNTSNTDACVAGCLAATCGDLFVQEGVEQCDDGAANDDLIPNACRTSCQSAHCGDGVVDSGEACDDHNTTSGDGCSATCTVEAVTCGNGFVEAGEGCDDGNRVNGDGCTAACAAEGGKQCFGQPSVCCASGVVISVPGQRATLTDALAEVSAGGCVFVASGTYDEAVSFNGNATVVGQGAATTTLTSSSTLKTLAVTNNGSLVIQGLTIEATAGKAVEVAQQGTVVLRHAVLGPAAKTCISATGSTQITITQSSASGCVGGGLDVASNTFTIENVFVSGNGSASSGVGGVKLGAPNQQGQIFRHNTVSGNASGSSAAAGVDCATVGTPVFGVIAWGNAGTALSAGCAPQLSDFEGGSGNGNLSVDPRFVGGGDLHLANGSPCIDRIATSATTTDIDGDARPQGASIDMGADERR